MNEINKLIETSTGYILVENEINEKLKTKSSLTIKFGADPTAADIHLGHTIPINILKKLQDMGHQIVFIIGDFTALVGDPTGKNKTRPQLTKQQVNNYSLTYIDQIFKILDRDKTKVLYNSKWLEKLNAADMIRLASKQTVARMLEREDFKKRYKEQSPIAIHEFLYPLLQAYDSVEIDADIEIGGTDQTFNLLMGRELQKSNNKEPQVVITLPLLVGTDGVKKMSKSQNNYIGINESPTEMFGKIMSISDELMWDYYNLISFLKPEEIQQLKQEVSEGKNPRDVKIMLAKEIIARFHDSEAANKAEADFINKFQKGNIPEDIPELKVQITADTTLPQLLKMANMVKSTSEGIRMIKQGAVRIDNEKELNDKAKVETSDTSVYQVGKRKFMKITTYK